MFVSIDMDALRFLHKHHDHETLSALAWLEIGQSASTRIEHYLDRSRFLANVSDLDVRMLYKNTTGAALPADADAPALRHQLAGMAGLLPVTRALTDEVLAQVAAVDDRIHDGERFRYALGSRVPAQPVDLFPLKARPLSARELAEAQTHSRVPVRGYPPRLTGQPRKPWEPEEPEVASAGGDVPVAPADTFELPPKAPKARSNSVQPVVFAAAKAAWEGRAEGATWADVRAVLVTKLEADGFHPTTVRIKLSKWAKENGV